MVSKPLSDVGEETIVLAESANIRFQDNRLSQNIILSFLIFYEILMNLSGIAVGCYVYIYIYIYIYISIFCSHKIF